MDYTRSILAGENPFKEKAQDVLKGLVEEVKALHKEVASTKVETYAERLKKGLPSTSSLPSSSSSSPPTSPLSSRSPTSTRSKKKQL